MFRRFLKYLLLLIVIVLLVTGSAIGWLFSRSQPQYAGHVAMPGLTGTVSVMRDEHGVPHIFAGDMNDAARALGYIHADERLFQMEMQRRAGAGRLSELFGADTLEIDKFVRTLGLYRLAQESFSALSPDARGFIQAYADGVNAWLNSHRHTLSPEFVLLRHTPEPWTPADSLVWGKLMALQLSKNYKYEVLRAHLADKLSPDKIKVLMPEPSLDAPITTRPELKKIGFNERDSSPAKTDALDQLGKLIGLDHAASNEWTISGARTLSGKPILANDPHLGLEAPILWYLARIVTPGLSIEGATVPGLPVVLLGQNGYIAWGFTTTGSDVQDLFVETVDPQDERRYVTPDGMEPFETRSETIHIKGEADVTLNVRMTRHGPVLSDIDDDLAELAGEGRVMALAFTGLSGSDATPEALMHINRAKNWAEFMSALQTYQAPPQNIVYADTAGNIGFVAAGLVPVRKKGDGLRPVDGDSGAYDWEGMIPVAHWPQLYNPPTGFVFNANNAIVGSDSAYFYGQDWEEPFRAERLQQFFNTIDKHSLDTSAAMQADVFSVATRQLLPYLLSQDFSDPQPAQAIELLRGWDGAMDKDKPQPLIFEAWLHHMHKLLLADKADDPLKPEGPYAAQIMLTILSSNNSWCDAPGTHPDCSEVIKQAFIEALDMLNRRDGPDMMKWKWGNEHITILRHKFWSHIPLMKKITDLSVASNGDFYTLNRGGSSPINPDAPFERTHGAGFRGIYDLSNPDNSRFMITTGESGHVLTPHYGDLVAPWNTVQSITLTGSRDELKARGAKELVFEPSR